MAIHVRIRNGMRKDPDGNGGATEGDIRGNSTDLIEQSASVPCIEDGHLEATPATPTPNMTVVLSPGVGYIPNADFDEFDDDSVKFWEAMVRDAVTLSFDSNSSGQPRIDLICLKMDVTTYVNYDGSNIATAVVVKGTPGAGIPATPSNYLKLYEILIADGETQLNTGDITDVRVQTTIKEELLPDHFTSKRIDKRVRTLTSTATLTPNIDNEDIIEITAQAAGLTIAAPTGTPEKGDTLLFRILDNGIARAITWNAAYRAIGTYLASTTVAGKLMYVGMIWNSVSSKWDVLFTGQE